SRVKYAEGKANAFLQLGKRRIEMMGVKMCGACVHTRWTKKSSSGCMLVIKNKTFLAHAQYPLSTETAKRLLVKRKDESRQYTLIIGAAPISNDDTLSFVVCDNSIKDGGGKIETSGFNFPLRNTCRSKICIFGKTKPDGTFQIDLYCTVAIHKITDTIH
ncbi:hypothetical protein JTE90_027189, partial [Oedothorax gibbosus]